MLEYAAGINQNYVQRLRERRPAGEAILHVAAIASYVNYQDAASITINRVSDPLGVEPKQQYPGQSRSGNH